MKTGYVGKSIWEEKRKVLFYVEPTREQKEDWFMKDWPPTKVRILTEKEYQILVKWGPI